MQINNFQQAQDFLMANIVDNEPNFRGRMGWLRAKHLFHLLQNPQNQYPVIHIAGTSGKTSTSYFISQILQNQGFRTGLTISPHLIDFTERIQINNQNINQEKFIQYLNHLLEIIQNNPLQNHGHYSKSEQYMALALYSFLQEKVQVAVVETGLGGLWDMTNVVDSQQKISVITKIGHDHNDILGQSLSEIMYQKAGIIGAKGKVVSLSHPSKLKLILERVAKENLAEIEYIQKNKNYTITNPTQNIFDFQFLDLKIPKIKLLAKGLHQIENASLAIAASYIFCQEQGKTFDLDRLYETLATKQVPGRLDMQSVQGREVLLDGAHNVQKMQSLIDFLTNNYPNQKFTFVLAFKHNKDYPAMLAQIIQIAEKIIITSFNVRQDLANLSLPLQNIANELQSLGFNEFITEENPYQATLLALQSKNQVVVTGSIYLLGTIYEKIQEKN